jgi:Uma2 family endonuclease
MLSPQRTHLISVEEYLRDELTREVKHEFLEGQIYAMAGASRNHQLIVTNMVRVFSTQLRNTPCDTFASDMKVRVGDLAFFYPDVIVTCQNDKVDEYYVNQPTIIVEVLSKSTRRMDETTKFRM